MRFDGLRAAPLLQRPHPEGLIVADGEEHLACGMQTETTHPVVMTDEREQARAGKDVPEADGTISRAGHDQAHVSVRPITVGLT